MNTDRDELIDAMSDASGMPAQTEVFAACLDALLAHPAAVLSLLENAKCETCGGLGAVDRPTEEWIDFGGSATCSACGGSGILGRDGVDKLRGFEQVGWQRPDGWIVADTDFDPDPGWQPVFARALRGGE